MYQSDPIALKRDKEREREEEREGEQEKLMAES